MNKIYIDANQLLEDAFKLAINVLESGFKPTFIIAVWRGGTPIGIAVQELLEVCGVVANHIAVRTSSYKGINERAKEVKVHGLNYAIESLAPEDNVLIVDDVHDSGLSVEELIVQLQQQCGERVPKHIKLATLYYKPKKSQVSRVPDFYLHETNEWLVFPHELAGLSEQEIKLVKPGLGKVRERLLQRFENRG